MAKSTEEHTLLAMYHCLFSVFGPQRWWPAETDVEVVIGAILTQNTAWTNVEKAILEMKKTRCLDFARIHLMHEEELAQIVHSAGTYKVKARRLKAFADWIIANYKGDLAAALSRPLQSVREDLLAIHGIGPETADAIILYGGNHPTFVVDAYTKRVLRRHGFIDKAANYNQVKDLLEGSLPCDLSLFNEFHALFVELAKQHCRAKANCNDCPLESWPHIPDA